MSAGTCRACGSSIVQPHTGRRRQWCHRCRPAGSPPPTSVLRRVLTERRARERARTAARSAAYRRVARAHPDEYAAALADERAKRGLDREVAA